MNFESTEEFVNELRKFSDSDIESIVVTPTKWGFVEKMESVGSWNGIKYKVYADVSQKNAVLQSYYSLDEFLEILSEHKISELDSKVFSDLDLLNSEGGQVDVKNIDWDQEIPLEHKEKFNSHESQYELFVDGEIGIDDVYFEKGNIQEIVVSINGSEYKLLNA